MLIALALIGRLLTVVVGVVSVLLGLMSRRSSIMGFGIACLGLWCFSVAHIGFRARD